VVAPPAGVDGGSPSSTAGAVAPAADASVADPGLPQTAGLASSRASQLGQRRKCADGGGGGSGGGCQAPPSRPGVVMPPPEGCAGGEWWLEMQRVAAGVTSEHRPTDRNGDCESYGSEPCCTSDPAGGAGLGLGTSRVVCEHECGPEPLPASQPGAVSGGGCGGGGVGGRIGAQPLHGGCEGGCEGTWCSDCCW
jgi:hypothetical protein